MIFTEAELSGVFIIEPKPIEDERGFFARTVCTDEFAVQGLPNHWPQQNIAFNHARGTLRGMHYQRESAAEIKLVRATRGAIYDVIIDLRPESKTYKKWLGVTLSEDNHKMLYIPKGFAHGYITLTDRAEIHYLVSHPYVPNSEGGVRYNDPAFGIVWPIEPTLISEKDKSWPNYEA